jgi:hypothetical protein
MFVDGRPEMAFLQFLNTNTEEWERVYRIDETGSGCFLNGKNDVLLNTILQSRDQMIFYLGGLGDVGTESFINLKNRKSGATYLTNPG